MLGQRGVAGVDMVNSQALICNVKIKGDSSEELHGAKGAALAMRVPLSQPCQQGMVDSAKGDSMLRE